VPPEDDRLLILDLISRRFNRTLWISRQTGLPQRATYRRVRALLNEGLITVSHQDNARGGERVLALTDAGRSLLGN
jgi:DNA-binding IclR family transcriptional regulator